MMCVFEADCINGICSSLDQTRLTFDIDMAQSVWTEIHMSYFIIEYTKHSELSYSIDVPYTIIYHICIIYVPYTIYMYIYQ